MCNIRVCLTWTVQKNYLDLRCRVNYLIYTVEFTNNKREEQGFCIHPNPFPSCYTSNNDTIIMQNSTTNTTYLRIHGHIDSHYNGEWACNHGTNRDSATINVTVLQSGILTYDKIRLICMVRFGFKRKKMPIPRQDYDIYHPLV